jgi:long-chain fatty acid transport protein
LPSILVAVNVDAGVSFVTTAKTGAVSLFGNGGTVTQMLSMILGLRGTMSRANQWWIIPAIALFWMSHQQTAVGQTFGIELHNNAMPASGGMGGASVSRPQDLQSAIAGNPATLRQFQGTQFSFGGAWADVDYSITQGSSLPVLGVSPYSAKSSTPGGLLGNIGLTRDLEGAGLPATIGLGLITDAGGGVNFRAAPQSNGTASQYVAIDIVGGLGISVTEDLTIGASASLGTSYLDGPFTDFAGMTTAYGARGTVGANLQLTQYTSLGAYWETEKDLNFNDAFLLPIVGRARDVSFEHPSNVVFGLANNRLFDGRLLLATDVVFKEYSNADLLRAIYRDQWCFQFGTQYALTEKTNLRLGYVYAQNPLKSARLESIGGVVLPDGVPAVRYVQGQFAAITENRITGGLGVRDLFPGMDLDLFAGYGFDADDQLANTSVSLRDNYWVGFGSTWRFGPR